MGIPLSEQDRPHDRPHDSARHDDADVNRNLGQVKRIIGVHSGKGGVGKTFISVNLAYALAAEGYAVGLLDADIDCPNVARFFDLDLALEGTPEGRIVPHTHNGVRIVSTHFLAQRPDEPLVVRGPIKHQVLSELLSKVDWGALDYLIIDLPPGTSDVPMSAMMIGRMHGIVLVTTPQKESLLDTRKSALMARGLQVPILGIVENMSAAAFGQGGGKRLAQELGLPFLGEIPLSGAIAKMNHAGRIAFRDFPQPALMEAVGVTLKKRGWWTAFKR